MPEFGRCSLVELLELQKAGNGFGHGLGHVGFKQAEGFHWFIEFGYFS